MKRRAFCLGVRAFVKSRSIGQPLASRRLDDGVGAGLIVHLAGVPAEGKLVRVALQVRFRDAVERAGDASLEDGEERLARVVVGAVLADVFALGVVRGAVPGELAANPIVDEAVVGMER